MIEGMCLFANEILKGNRIIRWEVLVGILLMIFSQLLASAVGLHLIF